jgi:Raf kinase inhibitor-like YbhB/YbcL family protein
MAENTDLKLSSPAFDEGGKIPDQYTCRGQDISPPLHIEGVPAGTSTLALILHDPDAPVGDFTHWTLWNIPSNITDIPAGNCPPGAIEGLTDFNKNGYGGPCPPSGTHRYMFDLYALKSTLSLPANARRADLEQALRDSSIAQCTLKGTFTAEE